MNAPDHFMFISKLIFYKMTAFFEVKNFHLKLLTSELRFALRKIFPKWARYDLNKPKINFKTKRGDFLIRDNPADFIIASPSFERQDIDYLIKLLKNATDHKKKIAFVDIGADFGKYLVTVAMKVKGIKILAFEPEPDSLNLLKKNIKKNHVQDISLFPLALSSKKGTKRFYIEDELHMLMSFGSSDESLVVKVDLLDNYISKLSKIDEVYIKLDVEGHEVEVLKGAQKFIQHFRKVVLLCEDSIVPNQDALNKYLTKNFTFLRKKSSYNSFWIKVNNF